ncbi:unnamed protein product, partial [Nesidiocoris tenuis]
MFLLLGTDYCTNAFDCISRFDVTFRIRPRREGPCNYYNRLGCLRPKQPQQPTSSS